MHLGQNHYFLPQIITHTRCSSVGWCARGRSFVTLIMDPLSLDATRPTWRGAKALGLSIVGSGLGFAVWLRIPYMLCRFGCSPFFLALVVCTLLVGWPVATAELLLGHYFRRSIADALAFVHVRLRGLAVAMSVGVAAVEAVYAATELSWVVFPYLAAEVAATGGAAATASDLRNVFFSEALFSDTRNMPAFGAVAGVWLLAGITCVVGVRSLAIASYILVPFAVLCMCGMVATSLAAVSDWTGVASVLTFSASDLASVPLWAHALGQSLLLVSAGSGTLVTFGSYARPVHNCSKVGAVCVVCQLALVLGVLFITVAALSLLRHDLPQPLSTVAAPPSSLAPLVGLGYSSAAPGGIGFVYAALVIYPAMFARIAPGQWSRVLGSATYAAIAVVGATSLAAAVLGIRAALADASVWFRGRATLGFIVVVAAVLSGALTLGVSFPVISAIDEVVVAIVLPLVVCLEMVGIGYLWADPGAQSSTLLMGLSLSKALAVVTQKAASCIGATQAAIHLVYHWGTAPLLNVLNDTRQSPDGSDEPPLESHRSALYDAAAVIAGPGAQAERGDAGGSSFDSLPTLPPTPSHGVRTPPRTPAVGAAWLPLLIKVVCPAACLAACVGMFVSLGRSYNTSDGERHHAFESLAIGVVTTSGVVATVVFGAVTTGRVTRSGRQLPAGTAGSAAVPWSDDVTLQAAAGVDTSRATDGPRCALQAAASAAALASDRDSRHSGGGSSGHASPMASSRAVVGPTADNVSQVSSGTPLPPRSTDAASGGNDAIFSPPRSPLSSLSLA